LRYLIVRVQWNRHLWRAHPLVSAWSEPDLPYQFPSTPDLVPDLVPELAWSPLRASVNDYRWRSVNTPSTCR
jgi:hypothetical protein